jgi:DNA-binding response OmpR family regulator
MKTVLVVEDEAPIAAAVAARLRSEGFRVEVAGTGPEGVERCRRLRPALVVLDLMLPGLDGLEVLRQVQRERPVPVLVLTARDSETDLLVGLGLGADDYVTKPFSVRELVARVHAILRRVERAGAPAGAPVRVGEVELDPAARRARRGGDQVHLTPTEFDLLHFLGSRPGVVFSREQLLAEVWGWPRSLRASRPRSLQASRPRSLQASWPDGAGTRTVDSHVQALRRKLGAEVVRTVHGVGYAAPEGAR